MRSTSSLDMRPHPVNKDATEDLVMASDFDEDEETVVAVPEVIDSGDTRVEQALTQAYLRFLNPS